MVIIKKIISFEKDLKFSNRCYDILSVSLEHSIDKIEEDLISGSFTISGEYKINEASITKERFDFDVGFDIALDNRYDTKNMEVDIDDFRYNIINNDILRVNIDLLISGDLIQEDTLVVNNYNELVQDDKDNDREDAIEEDKVEEVVINNSVLDNFNTNETYATYYVYIVKENDNIDKIIDMYNVTKEDLLLYNNLDNLSVGDKIIIPTLNGE